MKNWLWKQLAKAAVFLSDEIIEEAKKTPYFHLEGYMMRWWLFNPYNFDMSSEVKRHEREMDLFPSVRVHHILRKDDDRHLHDHPWDARTIILKGWYKELKEDGVEYLRKKGDTNPIKFGEYHRITEVSEGGVYTLFFTWKYMGTWGFLVDGVKVPWRKYLGMEKDGTIST